MTGNIAHLSDFKDFDGGYVTFGGGAYGGRITGKGTIKTDNLDFDDVYFVKELKFNLFSVSQMCDKKNYVFFTDSECLVPSPNFKLPDENHILLKIPRQDNMYSFDMKNIVPKDGLTCLVAKATSEESITDDDDRLKDENVAIEQFMKIAVLRIMAMLINILILPDQKLILVVEKLVLLSLKLILLLMRLVPTTPHTRIHKDHPIDHVIGDVQLSVQTRRMTTSYSELGFLSAIYEGKSHQDLHTCLFACFLSKKGTKQEFLKLLVIEQLVKVVYRNKEDERGISHKKQARLLLQDILKRGLRLDGSLCSWVELRHKNVPGLFFEDPDHFLDKSIGSKSIIWTASSTKSLVQQKKKGIFISQDKYVHEILRKYNYTDVKSASTPTDLEKPLVQDGDAADVDEHLYRSMIGSLMYLTASRPDIMFAVCACARFQVSPKTSHLLAVKRIFRYLKGKPSLGLWYSKDSPLELVAYTDSDYAGATQDRKSTTGGCQFLGNRLISWQCKKQTVVATSTTEAEYVAAASCCGQVLWIQNQLLDYGYNFMNTVIYIDNNSTICIIENPVQHSKTKHIEIRHHFIRDCNAKKLIQMAKIDTEHNVADLLTKGFDAGRFQYLVSSIGMLNP
ncbi:hypothetical protein Tco_1493894 [Tanacetum coccineum]